MSRTIASLSLSALLASLAAQAQTITTTTPATNTPATGIALDDSGAAQLDAVTVRGTRSFEERHGYGGATAAVTGEQLADTVNVENTEDALKYLPSLLVRKRYIGDTNAPVATRTTGINASARSLIFADGLLLSTLVNNNNGNGSPQWFLVAPNEIERIDVLYGPYSAQYAGNSYGAVVDITTRMPTRFEANAKLSGSLQDFRHFYGTSDRYGSYEAGGGIGDRIGRFWYRLSANHLDSQSQPITFGTLNLSTTPASASDPVITGAYADRNRNGAAIEVVGAGNITHTLQDNATLKLGYALADGIDARYTLGYWQNSAHASPATYLGGAGGSPYYGAGSGTVTIAGQQYKASAVAATFNGTRLDEQHLAQSLKLESHTGGHWDGSLQLALFDYLKDTSRQSTGLWPNALAGGAGRITDAGGTGWETLDAQGTWRPWGIDGANFLSFGLHGDGYTLDSPVYSLTGDWRHDGDGSGTLYSASHGKTATGALWVQDLWRITPVLTATTGLRYEWWRAYDGLNSNLLTSGPSAGQQSSNPQQPQVASNGISPKFTLGWDATQHWLLSGAIGRALRFPTVGELYQNVSTGTTYTKPNPFLKPEDVLSDELAAELHGDWGRVRAAVFQEQVRNALISQTSTLPGVSAPVSFTQNVDRTRQRGIEVVAEGRDLLLKGLELQGSVTYVDAHILRNDGYVATVAGATSVGRRTPYVPLWRSTLVATYRPDERWAFTLAGRYSARQYATVDNTDVNPHTYTGFDGFFVADARANFKLDRQWSLAAGVDNIGNRRYFLYHPFPERTFLADVKFDW